MAENVFSNYWSRNELNAANKKKFNLARDSILLTLFKLRFSKEHTYILSNRLMHKTITM